MIHTMTSMTDSELLADVETDNDQQNFEKIRLLTQMMREHEKQVVVLAKKRRKLMKNLRHRRVPFRLLAEATGTTEQAVYKDLRWGK